MYIGFSTTKKFNLFAHLIQWAENTPFSHVYVRMDWTNTGADAVYQASKLAVNMELVSDFDSQETVIKEFNFMIADDRQEKMLAYMKENLGKPYSILAVLQLACMFALQKLGFKVSDPERTGHSAFICSEIGADLCNIALGDVVPDNMVITPRDLYNKLSGISE